MSTAILEEPVPAKAKWEMPKASIGMSVLFWKDGVRGPKPNVGFVVGIGTANNIDVAVIRRGATTLETIVGSRHVDDPSAKEHDRQNAGGWDLTEETKALRSFME